MAGTTYDMTKEVEVVGEISPGLSPITIKIDFSKIPVKAADDNWKIFPVKDGWVLQDGYTRVPVASTSTADVDIGTAEDGTQLDTATDLSVQATDMTLMDTMAFGTAIIITSDGWIWLDFNTAAVTDGTLEIHLLIYAAPGEDSRVD